MLFTATTYTALLTVLATITGVRAQDECAGQPDAATYCTDVTWEDTTSDATLATTEADCMNTCQGINEDAGDWLVEFEGNCGPLGMVEYPCAFSWQPADGTSCQASFKVTNQDILNMMEGAIGRFAKDDGNDNTPVKVAAKGTAVCQGIKTQWFMQNMNA